MEEGDSACGQTSVFFLIWPHRYATTLRSILLLCYVVACVYILYVCTLGTPSSISVLMRHRFVPVSCVPPHSCLALTVQVLVSALLFPGLKASLQRLQLEYVDVVFANRPDNNTPMEG